MTSTLVFTALLMGLAGGPHCAAMCGAACTGIARAGAGGEVPVHGPGAGAGALGGLRVPSGVWAFQAGRLAGYALAGALAAGLVQGFAWLTTQAAALKPAWTLFHLAVLTWGLTLLVLARQPAWAQQAGLAAWGRIRPLVQRTGSAGVFGAGALWIFMPCGLLWSALLVASLAGGPLDGALAMALFAAGSSLGLVAGPVLLARLREAGNRLRNDWGTRLAGGLLAATALFALWMDLVERAAPWCLTP